MSGIYIPGVELPPIDEYLHLRIDGNGYVSMQISENQYICDLYDTDKKAVELPPHGDLIDRAEIRKDWFFTELGTVAVSLVDIDGAEAIIPADPEDKEEGW